jgi:uncharacterized membrane protein YdcZ (DUF606 family)
LGRGEIHAFLMLRGLFMGHDWHRAAKFVGCMCWAGLAGASVACTTANNVALNSRSEKPAWHAIYVGTLGAVLGVICSLPIALLGSRWGKPTQWWKLSGGFCTLPAFVMILDAPIFGTQIPCLFLLCGQLVTTFTMDWLQGILGIRDPARLGGLGIIIMGVAVDKFAPGENKALTAYRGIDLVQVVLLSVTAVAGASFAVQAKINSQLTKDLGHVARTVVVSNSIMVAVVIPVCLMLWLVGGVTPAFSAADWPRLVYAGLQSAFYTGSMSLLPEQLGYTVCFMMVHLGVLLCTTLLDANGVTGKQVPIAAYKLCSLFLVLLGLLLFNCGKPQHQRGTLEKNTYMEIENLTPPKECIAA